MSFKLTKIKVQPAPVEILEIARTPCAYNADTDFLELESNDEDGIIVRTFEDMGDHTSRRSEIVVAYSSIPELVSVLQRFYEQRRVFKVA